MTPPQNTPFRNILFQNAINRASQKTPPIWFMRQAGRYHNHYQNLRSKHSFDQLCKVPELASEVAMGPIQDFDFDVAILFSDILYPLQALGMGLEYTDHGPRLGFQLNETNFSSLKSVDESIHFMGFQKQAMKLTLEKLPKNKSLIGFVGGPWTLFVYAVEGSHAGSLIASKKSLNLYFKFAEVIENFLTQNIQLQLDGGAELVMIFDTAAGEVSPAFFHNYLQPVLSKLIEKFPHKLGYYSKGTQPTFFNREFRSLPLLGQGFDHRCSLDESFKLRDHGFVQGNFDQSLLHMETEDFKKQLANYIFDLKNLSVEQRRGWVSGLGHGVLPKTPEKNVHLFIDTIRKEF
jgi:uroporphyrinogen decarboxylase